MYGPINSLYDLEDELMKWCDTQNAEWREILKKLYNFWDDDWEEIALAFCTDAGIELTPEQCKSLIEKLGLPSKTIRASRISKDDFDYYSNLREGLGLSFYLNTKKAVIYRSCQHTGKNTYCNDSNNCITHINGKYRVCIHALFQCPECGKKIRANDKFEIDHVISFKRYWTNLKRVDIEEIKRWYNNVENLQIMCQHCNRSLGGK